MTTASGVPVVPAGQPPETPAVAHEMVGPDVALNRCATTLEVVRLPLQKYRSIRTQEDPVGHSEPVFVWVTYDATFTTPPSVHPKLTTGVPVTPVVQRASRAVAVTESELWTSGPK